MFRNGYNADPKTRLSQLKMRLWRAARVIIDLGSQLGAINKDEGIDLLVKGVGMEPSSSRYEVGRYLAAPGYYSGYVAGYREIERLREEFVAANGEAAGDSRVEDRGDAADAPAGRPSGRAARELLKTFHDRLLRCGPIPFDLIRDALLETKR